MSFIARKNMFRLYKYLSNKMFIMRCLNTTCISLFLQSLIQVVSENGTCTCKEYLNTNKLSVYCIYTDNSNIQVHVGK